MRLMSLQEGIPKVRCRVSVHASEVRNVTLRGELSASDERFVLSEARPGLWIAWLLLKPGCYRCEVTARLATTGRERLRVYPCLLRWCGAVTVPDTQGREARIVWLRTLGERSRASRRIGADVLNPLTGSDVTDRHRSPGKRP